MAAVPFAKRRLQALRPLPYAEAPATLGEHLRRARVLQRLTQAESARRTGVERGSYEAWERDETAPAMRYWPRIIEFLGYDPIPASATLSQRLRGLRRRKGWSQAQLAAALTVEESTVRGWELGEHPPNVRHRGHLEELCCAAGIVMPTEDVPGFPAWLRNLRWRLGLTQAELARMVGVDRDTVSCWENGHTRPRGRYLERLGSVAGSDAAAEKLLKR